MAELKLHDRPWELTGRGREGEGEWSKGARCGPWRRRWGCAMGELHHEGAWSLLLLLEFLFVSCRSSCVRKRKERRKKKRKKKMWKFFYT
jgi:hypothetical protein